MPLPQDIRPNIIQPAQPPLPPKPESKLFLLIALAVILAVLLLAGYFYYQNYQKKPPAKVETKKISDKCVISQREFYKGDNTENDCQTCDPSISETSWTNKIDGTSCHNNQGTCLKGECLPILTPQTAGKEGAPAP